MSPSPSNAAIHPAAEPSSASGLSRLWFHEEYGTRSFGFQVSEVLYSQRSKFQQIDVLNTHALGKLLLLDGMVMTCDQDEFIYHELIAHVPLCHLPSDGQAKQVLVIGGGDGGTVREVLKHPDVERVVLCEIDGDVIEVCKQHFPAIASELDNPRVDIQVRDGVAFLAEAQPESYDAILIDSTDPVGPGEGLFNTPFYQSAFRALKPHGVLAAQSESPISDPNNVQTIYNKLRQVFPIATGFWGTVPTYPGSIWTWAFCSKQVQPLTDLQAERFNAVTPSCRYLSPAGLQGALALPPFVEALVKPQGLAVDPSALNPKAAAAC